MILISLVLMAVLCCRLAVAS